MMTTAGMGAFIEALNFEFLMSCLVACALFEGTFLWFSVLFLLSRKHKKNFACYMKMCGLHMLAGSLQ